jgi:hypothetical protein
MSDYIFALVSCVQEVGIFLLQSTIDLVTLGKGLHSSIGKRFCVCDKSMWQNLLLCWRKWWRQVHSPYQ